MNTLSNTAEPRVESHILAAEVPAIEQLYWSVRRELWENRAIYLAPMAAAAVAVAGFTVGKAVHVAMWMQPGMGRPHESIEQPYMFASLLIMFSSILVALFYCLDAFQSERRDRSILFWKSLPVSDGTTAVAKFLVPVGILQIVSFAVTVAAQWIMFLIHAASVAAGGGTVTALWTGLSLPRMWAMLLFHLIALHGLWYAPFYGWLLMVSAWARRNAFLWATLPPLGIALVEKIAFNTSHFAAMLGHRFWGSSPASTSAGADYAMELLMPMSPIHFLTRPGLWIGLAVTAVFLVLAVRLRRHRGPA
ncbi:MAG: ABC transporter permease [Terriglobales bacterium]